MIANGLTRTCLTATLTLASLVSFNEAQCIADNQIQAEDVVAILRSKVGDRLCTALLSSPDIVQAESPRASFEYALSKARILKHDTSGLRSNYVRFSLQDRSARSVVYRNHSHDFSRSAFKVCFGTVLFTHPTILSQDRFGIVTVSVVMRSRYFTWTTSLKSILTLPAPETVTTFRIIESSRTLLRPTDGRVSWSKLYFPPFGENWYPYGYTTNLKSMLAKKARI